MKIIGITGKIGSGKTTVARILEGEGAYRLDCDEIVHELYEAHQRGAEKIQTFFGDEFLLKNKSVNRKKLTRILIKTPKKWEILNRLIHPLVAEELRKRLKKIPNKIVALEIQIPNKKLFSEFIDELWIIEADKAIRQSRIQSMPIEEIKAIEKQQKGLLDPNAKHINNNASLEELEQEVKQLV